MNTTTHVGKIGRLSKDCRNELARRIEDGLPGADLVKWLNGLADVQEVLKEQFGGRAITEQNFSLWKQSGHAEWLRHEAARECTRSLVERSDDLDELGEESTFGERLSVVMGEQTARLALGRLEAETDLEKRWQRLCEINREVSQMRRDDDRGLRTAIQRERWQREMEEAERVEEERRAKATKERRLETLIELSERESNAEMLYGGGPAGRKMAEWLYRAKLGMSCADLMDGTWEKKEAAREAAREARRKDAGRKAPENSGKSKLIQANPTKKKAGKIRRAKDEIRKKSEGRRPKRGVESGSIKPQTPLKHTGPNLGLAKTPVPLEQHEPKSADFKQTDLKHTGKMPVPLAPEQIRRLNRAAESKVIRPADRQAEARRIFMPAMASLKTELEEIKPEETEIRRPKDEIRRESEGPNPNRSAESNVIRPGGGGEPSLKHTGETPVPLPPVPLGPEQEAYNCWFQMNRGAEPFSQEKLDKLYAAIPAKKT